ncbi:MAG TPA: hypothetical protein VGI86_01580 [Acidimicrobiia bacterium]
MTIGPITNSTQATTQATQTDYNSAAWRKNFGDAFDAIASKLGMSKSDLISSLQSGQTMSDLESQKGVSKNDIISAAASALQKDDPSLSADAATKLATSFYDGKVGHRHHHAAGTTGPGNTGPGNTTTTGTTGPGNPSLTTLMPQSSGVNVLS